MLHALLLSILYINTRITAIARITYCSITMYTITACSVLRLYIDTRITSYITACCKHQHMHYCSCIYYCMLYTSTHALLHITACSIPHALLHTLLHAPYVDVYNTMTACSALRLHIDTHITALLHILRHTRCAKNSVFWNTMTACSVLRLYIDTRITVHTLLHALCIDTRITAYITPCVYAIHACSMHRLYIDARSLHRHTRY